MTENDDVIGATCRQEYPKRDAISAADIGICVAQVDGYDVKPSIFTSTAEEDMRMLSRHYQPNIFAMRNVGGEVGVADDVQGWQLRCAARLRMRQKTLNAIDLESAWRVHRHEMEEADAFLDKQVRGWPIGRSASAASHNAAAHFAGPAPPPERPIGAPARCIPGSVGGSGPIPNPRVPCPGAAPFRDKYQSAPYRAFGAAPFRDKYQSAQYRAFDADTQPAARLSNLWQPSASDLGPPICSSASHYTATNYLDELLHASPQGYASAVRHLAAASPGAPRSSSAFSHPDWSRAC